MNMKREKIRIIIISLVVFIIITGVTMYGYRQPQAISQTEDGFVTKQVLDHLAEIAVDQHQLAANNISRLEIIW